MDEKQLKDEQELAKVLAGINNVDPKVLQEDETDPDDILKSFNNQGAPKPIVSEDSKSDGFELPDFENSANPKTTAPVPLKDKPSDGLPKPSTVPIPATAPMPQAPMQKPKPNPAPSAMDGVLPSSIAEQTPKSNLEAIKKDVINDLKPLVNKLELPDDEKFDTYLLLIRSTDDENLIAPAYEVAKKITDEKKRAQALLDIVKEINYFTLAKK